MLIKKRYVVNIGGEQHAATIARDGDGVMLELDGAALAPVEAASVLGGRAFAVTIGKVRRLVHLTPADRKGGLRATINGRPVALTVMDELRAQALESLGAVAGSGTLTADIPGLVVEIRVKPGQIVHRGEPVIVVEAMKMQNELCAGVSGTVTTVAVTIGQSVNPGDTLVVIEPEPGV